VKSHIRASIAVVISGEFLGGLYSGEGSKTKRRLAVILSVGELFEGGFREETLEAVCGAVVDGGGVDDDDDDA
jgi:hypothetical protein